MLNQKIKSQKELVKIVNNLKQEKKIIVVISGSFDVLHIGHIRSIKEAKRLGDVLIVLLNSDKSVRIYKGLGRPINPQNDRAEFLAALKDVDFVTIFDEINPVKILEKIKPNIYCQGKDWGKNCIERTTIEKYGGKIHILEWQKGFSSTNLIKKDFDIQSISSIGAVFLDRDGTININNPSYLYKIEDFKFTPFALSALKRLSDSDFKIIIVTNQSGVGRGYFKDKDLKKLHLWLFKKLKKEGIRIDKIYYCPHLPKDGCPCRKPEPGMIFKAVKDFNIDLNKSWIIGDDERDVILGRKVNMKTIKLGKKMSKHFKLEPNYYANNLLEAVKIIQTYSKG